MGDKDGKAEHKKTEAEIGMGDKKSQEKCKRQSKSLNKKREKLAKFPSVC